LFVDLFLSCGASCDLRLAAVLELSKRTGTQQVSVTTATPGPPPFSLPYYGDLSWGPPLPSKKTYRHSSPPSPFQTPFQKGLPMVTVTSRRPVKIITVAVLRVVSGSGDAQRVSSDRPRCSMPPGHGRRSRLGSVFFQYDSRQRPGKSETVMQPGEVYP